MLQERSLRQGMEPHLDRLASAPARSTTNGSELTRKMASKVWLIVSPALRTRSSARNPRCRKKSSTSVGHTTSASNESTGTSSATSALAVPLLPNTLIHNEARRLPEHGSDFSKNDEELR